MPSRHAAVALAAVAALGLSTGCEKQSPYVTLTANGVTVKARATKYCRGTACDETTGAPVIKVSGGDALGIDVPRSLADQGWQIPELNDQAFIHDHYRKVPLPQGLEARDVTLTIRRDPKAGEGIWQFTLRIQ
jgi:hypothetical protein